MNDAVQSLPYVKPEYPQSEISGWIITAAQQVHRTLGLGFEEVIYQRALALEFPGHGLDFSREVWMDVHYHDREVGLKQVDFLVDGVMVKIKARVQVEDVDVIQTMSYLKASRYAVSLLLNFGAKKLEIKRLIHTKGTEQ